eukprot:1330407-Amorphochlora_amoeboformis.AAC.1
MPTTVTQLLAITLSRGGIRQGVGTSSWRGQRALGHCVAIRRAEHHGAGQLLLFDLQPVVPLHGVLEVLHAGLATGEYEFLLDGHAHSQQLLVRRTRLMVSGGDLFAYGCPLLYGYVYSPILSPEIKGVFSAVLMCLVIRLVAQCAVFACMYIAQALYPNWGLPEELERTRVGSWRPDEFGGDARSIDKPGRLDPSPFDSDPLLI